MLKETYIALLKRYSADKSVIDAFWSEIENHYSSQDRHYHTLAHLENILNQLNHIKEAIDNWDAILFSLFYHDIIYDAEKSNNEAESSKIALKRMHEISVPEETKQLCEAHILATKAHTISPNSDTNYFTDADLSVLGQDWSQYESYYLNVRKEYAVYPDKTYVLGRINVLQHFLKMDRVFKTDYFYQNFNLKAKENIQKELEILNEKLKQEKV